MTNALTRFLAPTLAAALTVVGVSLSPGAASAGGNPNQNTTTPSTTAPVPAPKNKLSKPGQIVVLGDSFAANSPDMGAACTQNPDAWPEQLGKLTKRRLIEKACSGASFGSANYQIGDEVYGRPRDLRIGTFAEYIAVDHADLALKPKSLTMEQAAAVPLVALAGWQALVELAQIRPGQKVLIHAGAGGLGSTVIQLAKHLGAYVATTASGKDAARVRTFGADEVIDYTTQNFAERLSGYDVVLDSLGGDNLKKSLTVLKPGGLAISVVGPPDPAFAVQLGQPLLKPVMWLLSRKVRAQAKKLGEIGRAHV